MCGVPLQISIAKGTHDLKELGGPVLQPGFTLKGKMSLLGIETTGAISLLPKDVSLTGNLFVRLTSTAMFYVDFINHTRRKKKLGSISYLVACD